MLEAKWLKQTWYTDPELEVTVFSPALAYAVSVEFRFDDAGPYVTGIAVRRHRFADGWSGERTHVQPRDVQRLPIARIMRAASAFAATAKKPKPRKRSNRLEGKPLDPRVVAGAFYYDVGAVAELRERGFEQAGELVEAGKVLVPRGRPRRGRTTSFYREIATAYREFEKQGKSPAREIARRKGVSVNTVYQWIHRARGLGFLEPSSRRRTALDG
jgi:hypothetical protein